jgi:hypothetical protein
MPLLDGSDAGSIIVELWEMPHDEGGKPHKQADCT